MYQQSYSRKFEVNSEWSESKTKQSLYIRAPLSSQQTLQQRQFEIVQKANLRIYCSDCELDLTRNYYIITKNDYYCVRCFSNLDDFPQEYLVRRALKQSFTNSNWDIMDEVVLTTAFKLWGFGNWSQIKQYLDYNCSPFPLKQIEDHFQKYYLHTKDYIPSFDKLLPAKRKNTFGQMNQEYYSRYKINSGQMKRRDSKGQKKLLPSLKSLSMISSSRQIEVDKDNNNHDPKEASEQILSHLDLQSQFNRKEKQKKIQGSILGYNVKRKQFQPGEYDYTAQNMLADLQFYETDTEQQQNLKIEIILAYNKRLQQRLKRRQFVIQYKLLDSQYQFNQQTKFEKQTSQIFQSFMRFTQNNQQFRSLVDNYTIAKRYQKYLTNLTKIRRKQSKDGLIIDSYNFMKRKRQKYIDRWEKTYNRTYNDKKRNIIIPKRQQQSNSLKLVSQLGADAPFQLPINPAQLVSKSIESQKQILKINNIKIKMIYNPQVKPVDESHE